MRRPPHPALTRHAAYLAFELAASLRGAVDRELRELGMTWPDYAVLAITDALEGPSEEAISNRAGVDRGSAACSHRRAQDPLFRHPDGQRRGGRGRWRRRRGVPHDAPAPAR
jgi:hypothetical protein